MSYSAPNPGDMDPSLLHTTDLVPTGQVTGGNLAPPAVTATIGPPANKQMQHLQFLSPSVNPLMLCVCLPSGTELLSLQNKKGRNQSAAVQFVKTDWGTYAGRFALKQMCALKEE